MWLDPASGRIFGSPEEWADGLAKLDPLLRRALLNPEQLTAKEHREVETKLVSFIADYLSDQQIQELVREADEREPSADPEHDAATKHTLEGKLALREIGAARQQHFQYGLVNPHTGEFVAEVDLSAGRKKRKAKAKPRKKGKTKRKPKG